jgi:putative hydrolase of the HAD superfamily
VNVVFDFGVVLFDWQPAHFLPDYFPLQASTPQLARSLAIEVFSHADWHAFDQGALQVDEVVQRTAKRLGLDAAILKELVATIPDLLVPVEATVDILHSLDRRRERHGDIQLYFLSNMPAPIARTLELRHGFLKLFEGGIFSGDVNLVKPQAEIFRLMESRFGLAPGQTLFIDDLQTNVAAARACGWHAVHFESALQLAQELQVHLA